MKIGFPYTFMRYIGGEMVRAFLVTLGVVTLLWVLAFTLQLVRRHIMGPTEYLIIMPLLGVASLAYTLPIATLFGVSIAYGRLSADNEIRAMAWNGVHLAWMILPACVMAVVATAASIYVNTQAVPSALRTSKRIITSGVMDAVGRTFVAAAYSSTAVEFATMSMRMEDFDKETNTATGVNILIADAADWKVTYSLSADAARVIEGKVPGALDLSIDSDRPETERHYISFVFVNGVIQEYDREARMALSARAPAPPVALDIARDIERMDLKELSWRELARFAETTGSADERNEARTLLYERIALGMSPFFFALVAAPMAMVARWKHTLTSFLPSLVIATAVYYPLVMWAKIKGEAGTLDPALGMFAGNALMLVLSAILMIVVLRR